MQMRGFFAKLRMTIVFKLRAFFWMCLLEETAFGEVADEAEVGGEEVVGGESREWGPADFVEDAVVEVAVEVVDDEELQVDGAAVAVLVADAGYAAAYCGGDAQLFVEFACQGSLGGLAGFDLSAGELPLEAHGLVGAALTDENLGLMRGVIIWRGFGGGGRVRVLGCVCGAQDERRDHPADGLGWGVGVVPIKLGDGLFHLSNSLDE